MTTSVVIPAFNGWDHLEKNLKTVLALGADEVIVVDDASADGTAGQIAARYPSVKLIVQTENRRFPLTVNHGFAAAKGDVVFLFNQDVTPGVNLIRTVLPYFRDRRVFAVTFNESRNSYARAEFRAGFLHFENGPAARTYRESFWASGGSAAFRRSVWNELGGFDKVFSPGYYEDLDLGWRARRRGYRILWVPEAKVRHVRETAFNRAFSPEELVRIKERNYLLCHWRNLDTANLVIHLRAVFFRSLLHPGYTRPMAAALGKIRQVISFRRQERNFIVKTDHEIFPA